MTPLLQAGGDFFRERGGEPTCVERGGLCPGWIVDNLDRYWTPLIEHLVLVGISVGAGATIALALALAAHRRRALVAPITQATGVIYTIPSLALFFLLLPITGRGTLTAVVALTAYTLLVLFRNTVDGLAEVPGDARDAGRGMGLTDRQLLWRVELPLALPAIVTGLRIATTTTVALAALAFYAGAGGLGAPMEQAKAFDSNVIVAGGLCVLLAIVLDGVLLLVQRALTPWSRA